MSPACPQLLTMHPQPTHHICPLSLLLTKHLPFPGATVQLPGTALPAGRDPLAVTGLEFGVLLYHTEEFLVCMWLQWDSWEGQNQQEDE